MIGDRAIAGWLFTVAGLVFLMVAVGGLTRLTKSGLSMTEWKPATGLPPLTLVEWQEEFRKYQQFPEFRLMNSEMTLSEFKFIYWMEFGHRQLGRFIGFAFALPLAYFALRGRLSRPLLARLSLLLAAGATQASIGWWMVKSGLESPHSPGAHSTAVHVSPYRLATHLLSAFTIYSLVLHTALLTQKPITAEQASRFVASVGLQRMKKFAAFTAILTGVTVASGAFVAGNEAGLVYSEWPWMGGRFVPEDLTSPYLTPKWRNLFEHSTLVQFDHRMLAYATFITSVALFLFAHRVPNLSSRAKFLSRAVVGMATAQASLGIITLVNHVPIPLASLHQCGSLVLLSLVIAFFHACGGPRAKSLAVRLLPVVNARINELQKPVLQTANR